MKTNTYLALMTQTPAAPPALGKDENGRTTLRQQRNGYWSTSSSSTPASMIREKYYCNSQMKNRLLGEMATELQCLREYSFTYYDKI